MPDVRLARVAIVGGGFGGLYAAFALGRSKSVQVTVIDRKNYHLFQPFLYQVATAGLSPGDIAQPLRHILQDFPNIAVLMAEVVSVKPLERRILLADGGSLPYDFLILASGASHSYFGHEDWAPYAPGLKTVEDALEIRSRILAAFEKAEREENAERRQALLTFVVVGAGPTGVELAGAIMEIAGHTMVREFRRIDPRQAKIFLLEAAPRILPGFDPILSGAAAKKLAHLGVAARTNTAVTRIGQGYVEAGKWRIPAETVIWAAGVGASSLGSALGTPLDNAGRVRVHADLTTPGHPEVFVIGDLATIADEHGRPLPGMAPAAIQMGRHAAHNILRAISGKLLLPFRYRDKGMLATIGRHAAVAQIGSVRLKGFIAWLAWLLVHILFLIGFRNKILVLLEWSWSYLTFNRGVRLIMDGRGRE